MVAVASGPVEVKVLAGTAGAGAGGIISAFLLWLLGTYAFHGGVPAPVTLFLELVVTVGLAFVGGWLAPHTLRPDLRAVMPADQ